MTFNHQLFLQNTGSYSLIGFLICLCKWLFDQLLRTASDFWICFNANETITILLFLFLFNLFNTSQIYNSANIFTTRCRILKAYEEFSPNFMKEIFCCFPSLTHINYNFYVHTWNTMKCGNKGLDHLGHRYGTHFLKTSSKKSSKLLYKFKYFLKKCSGPPFKCNIYILFFQNRIVLHHWNLTVTVSSASLFASRYWLPTILYNTLQDSPYCLGGVIIFCLIMT